MRGRLSGFSLSHGGGWRGVSTKKGGAFLEEEAHGGLFNLAVCVLF